MTEEVEFVDARSGRVAYQAHGQGDLDFVLAAGLVGHLDVQMEQPRYRRFIEELGRYGRVIRFDRRGTGLSDPIPTSGDEIWELWSEDLLAVLDHADSRQPVIVAANDAGPTGFLFAATFPERVQALVVFNTTARFLVADDYPEGHPPEVAERIVDHLRRTWGSEASVDLLAPSLAADLPFRRWYARFQRGSGSPAVVAETMDRILRIDVRGALPEIRCPTLVLHREGNAVAGPDHGRYLARVIPNATFELLPGADSAIMTQGMQAIVDRIGAFVDRTPASGDPNKMFSTVLFTDIVSSTELALGLGDRAWQTLLDEHDALVRDLVAVHQGRLIKTTGDGVLATFEAPTKALRCVDDIRRQVERLGIVIRAALHAGPVVIRHDGDISGVAVNIAARVLAQATAGEALVTTSIPDLLVGESFAFTDRGSHHLKGIPEPQRLLAVASM